MIGDALSDLEAGSRAGVGRLILVRTGRGALQEKSVMAANLADVQVFESLMNAAQALFPKIA